MIASLRMLHKVIPDRNAPVGALVRTQDLVNVNKCGCLVLRGGTHPRKAVRKEEEESADIKRLRKEEEESASKMEESKAEVAGSACHCQTYSWRLMSSEVLRAISFSKQHTHAYSCT